MQMVIRTGLALAVWLGALGFAQADSVVYKSSSDWSGFYIGAQGGYGFGSTAPTYQAPLFPTQTFDFGGGLGGLKAGYQVQSGRAVFGLEVDGSLGDLSGARDDSTGINPPCLTPGEGCTANVDWLATARARLGYAQGNFMPYLTAGVALGGLKGTFDTGACDCRVDTASLGWVAGAGAEFKISDRVSTNAELLYVGFGSPNLSTGSFNGGVATGNYHFGLARVGLSYHF